MTHRIDLEGLLPSLAYARGVEQALWNEDSAQREVLPILDRIHHQVIDVSDDGLIETWLKRGLKRWRKNQTVQGLYLWGGVGRGKTFLMDLLYDSVPNVQRFREHFHRFMGLVHADLRQRAGMQNPLDDVADEWAGRTRLICLDEFIVHDIGDAMLLGNLFKALFARGVVLVTTSNTAPKNLYRDGLQRARFLPAIALLEQHCQVHELSSVVDYRLRTLSQASVYLDASHSESESELSRIFDQLAPGSDFEGEMIEVLERQIPVKRHAESVIWLEFDALCNGPRAVADYIEIAKQHNTVMLSKVPIFDGRNEDAAKRFVHLIDELYDRRVNLVLSAHASPTTLYRGSKHVAEFERTASRLIEMQSHAYMAAEHGA